MKTKTGTVTKYDHVQGFGLVKEFGDFRTYLFTLRQVTTPTPGFVFEGDAVEFQLIGDEVETVRILTELDAHNSCTKTAGCDCYACERDPITMLG